MNAFPQQSPQVPKRGQSVQTSAIMRTVEAILRQQLQPLKQAINLILQKLDIQAPFHQESFLKKRSKRQRKSRPKYDLKQIDLDDINISEAQYDSQNFPPHFFAEETLQSAESEDFVLPQPRGNNSAFNPVPFPDVVPFEGIRAQHREEWQKLYRTIKRLVEGKRARNERGWFDFEKKMLLDFVTKGASFGSSVNHLTQMLGVSSSTFKRWRNFFK